MKISKAQSNYTINFKQNADKHNIQEQTQTITQAKTQEIKALPAQHINANVPSTYTKTGEFILPGTDTKVQMYKLSNGQKIIFAPKKGSTMISTYVDCGSMNETDNIRGISHFIEHNLFNGSEKINPKELFDKVNKMGAYTNAWTHNFATCYLMKSHLFDSEDLSKIIELHADMIQTPKFEQAQLDKEKGVVNSELTMYDDINIRTLLGKSTKQLFQINSDSTDLVGGTVKNINNLTREDVVSYYNQNYTPDKMTTVVTGEFNPDEVIKLLAKNFTKKGQATQPQFNEPLKPIEKSIRSDITSPLISNDEFILSFAGPANNNIKDMFCIDILSNILSGSKHAKLYNNLKSLNVNPDIFTHAISNQKTAPQEINIVGSCTPEKTEEALKTIYSTIHNLQFEDLEETIETEKKVLEKNLLNIFETGDGMNAFLGDFLTNYKAEEVEKIPEIIQSITQDDIKNALKKYFDLNKTSIVVSHPIKKAEKEPISFKGKLEKTGLDLSKVSYAKLPNNAEVYLTDDKSKLKNFTMEINCEFPAFVNPLMLSVFEKILSKGSTFKTEEDFSKDLSKKCANLNFFVSSSGIHVKGNALNDDINYALSKAIETINNPKINAETLEEVKKDIRKSINEKRPHALDYLNQVFFPQKRTAPTKEDRLKALDEVKLEDILGFCEYLKQNSSLYFTWNKKDVPYELTQLGQFKPTHKGEKFRTYIPLEKDVIKTQKYEAGQANIIQAFKFPLDLTVKEQATIDMMNSILGDGQASRLFNDLRETQKLAYHTGSHTEINNNTGLIILEIGTTTDNPQDKTATSANVTKALEGFKRNIDKMKTELVSKEELEAAKLTVKSNILNGLERNIGRNNMLLTSVIKDKNPNFINEYLKEIENITEEDIQKIAQKVFAGHSLTSIVANEKTLKELNLHQ